MILPSAPQMRQAFPRGPLATAQTVHKGLADQERAGRLMRDVQMADNCASYHQFTATFSSSGDSGTPPVSEWLEFGRIAFVGKPTAASASERVGPDNTDPNYYAVPCTGRVYDWKTNEKGLYVAVRVESFALGPVPDGWQAVMHVSVHGPAIRLGSSTASA